MIEKKVTDLVFKKRRDVFTSSVIIANELEVEHKDLVRTIEKLINFLCAGSPVENDGIFELNRYSGDRYKMKFIKTTYKNKRGREYKSYDMNRPAFMKLVMQLGRYKKAHKVQNSIIQAFFGMEDMLLNIKNKNWLETRNETKAIRGEYTDIVDEYIKYAVEQGSTFYKNNPQFAYSNFTKVTNKALTTIASHPLGKPIRDYLNKYELIQLSYMESTTIQLIEIGMEEGAHYKVIYERVKVALKEIADFYNKTNPFKGRRLEQ